MDLLTAAFHRLEATDPAPLVGRVHGVTGLVVECRGPRCRLGDLCWLGAAAAGPLPGPGVDAGQAGRGVAPDAGGVWAEVVGFRAGSTLLMPLGPLEGIAPGWAARTLGRPLQVPVGDGLLGRVVDGLGRPLDDLGPLAAGSVYPAVNAPPPAMRRQRIERPLSVGVRAIDGLLTVGRGQRLGIFAGSGVGKSTLLGMMARATDADVSVIALVGERGREVREFIEADLGPAGLGRSVVVVATSDEPPLVRIKAALAATAMAEYFRDQGRHVVLMMDSVTRLAMAQREVGLAAGEPPTTRGYTPSTFTLLPRLLERAGPGSTGSITGFYTVLVDGDDMNEPVADAVRGILDGHVVLSRRLAQRGHFPAIDVLQSVSRLMTQVAAPDHQSSAQAVRSALALWAEAEDLVQIGAYKPGANPALDAAMARLPDIQRFLQQSQMEPSDLSAAVSALTALCPPGDDTG